MMGEWRTMPFPEAVSLNPPVALQRGKAYPFVEMAAVNCGARDVGESEKREFTGGGARFEPGDTLMARITPCLENGKIARFRPNDQASIGFGSTEFIVVRGKDGVTTDDFAYYVTKWDEFRQFAINQMTGSSGRQRVPADALAGFKVSIPPLPEQRAIAHILGTLDDKIELNRRMNETLEAMARALFQSWFVDFDPVRRNIERRRGKTVSAAGGMAELDALFPDSFVDSELGKIPKGWRVVPLGNVVQNFDSKRIPLSKRQRLDRQGAYRYYGAAGVLDHVDDFLFDGVYVLLGEDGSVEQEDGTPVVQYVWGRFWVNNHAHVLQAKGGVSDEHLLLFLRQVCITPYVTGAVQPKLNQGNMNTIPFLMLGRHVCGAFGDRIAPLFALLRENEEEIAALAVTRDALLPKLLSGVIRIKDVEKFVEDVA